MVFENWQEKLKKAEFWLPAVGGLVLAAVGTAPKRMVKMKASTKKYTALSGLAILFGVGALLAFDPPVGGAPTGSRSPVVVNAGMYGIPVSPTGIQAYPTRAPYYG